MQTGTPTFDGESITLPPFPHHATPPSTTAPHHPRRGGNGQRIPHHTNTTDTHSPPTPHPTHLAMNSTRHDSSTRQHCSGMSRARATPPHRAGRQQHTPPPFHTPRRVDTIHSSTLTHSRSHNQRTIMIDEQQSSFND